MGDHLPQARVWSEKVLANVVALFDGVALEFAVNGGVHLVEKNTVFVLSQQLVPFRAPDDFDDVPTGSAEHRFKFLDDFPVASNRSIEALQVAVHHKDEVVELLAGGERDGTQGFGLVGLAITEKRPHPAI